MYYRTALCLFVAFGLSASAQTTINVRGTISNQAGKPIANATVRLAGQGLSVTTTSTGAYSITRTGVVELQALVQQPARISLRSGILEIGLANPSPVQVEIFDVKGNRLKKEFKQDVSAGVYRLNIAKNCRATNVLVIRATIGTLMITFHYMPLYSGTFTVDQYAVPVSARLMKTAAAAVDTLKTSATGYLAKSVPISSWDSTVNITLDTAGGGVRPSSGCGKTTTLKGQQRLKISVGGKDREYIIRLPDDYEPNTPYRLWFSIHCLGGTASGVADARSYEYYGIWKFANPTGGKGTTIFCSPEGLPYSGTSLGWGNSGGSDVQLIRTLIQKFESELCIDQARIFAEGFSMGGSMSYALACAMPDTFRAVCMHSGGAMSGCDQSHRGPVAMFITHGTNDPVCKYPGSGVSQIKDLAQRNNCTAMDIPSLCNPTDGTGLTPACADYKGCKDGYPCKACIFVGGHDPSPGGQSKTWVDDSTWSFFKQF